MKVSEKTLELNIGAELLGLLRQQPALHKTYLRGLTQSQERREGVDFFAQLDARTKLFAFQFKAPKGMAEKAPYKYTLVRHQNAALHRLANAYPGAVFYVFPYFVTPAKIHAWAPKLLGDTWFLDVAPMTTALTFADHKRRTVSCANGVARINPEFRLVSGGELSLASATGIPAPVFAEWYAEFRSTWDGMRLGGVLPHQQPWQVRGLQLAIATP